MTAGRANGRGFFAIGIVHSKAAVNVGTLWRSAHALGASFIFTVGRRYSRQATDTTKAWLHLPLFHFETLDDLIAHLPNGCPLVGVELDPRAKPLPSFHHPEQATYLLGGEDVGLTESDRRRCHRLVQIPGAYCLNVAAAGSIVLYDRVSKASLRLLDTQVSTEAAS